MSWSLFCGNSGGLKQLDRSTFRPKNNCTVYPDFLHDNPKLALSLAGFLDGLLTSTSICPSENGAWTIHQSHNGVLYTKYVIPVVTSEYEKGKYMGMDVIYSKECSKIWTVECKKGGNMCVSCSMIRTKRGGSSLLVMIKAWKASIQPGLERREKTTLTVQNFARNFAKKPDKMSKACGLELRREAIAQIEYITRME